jgi:ribosomal protein S18 acetylase RimI-like enzyme
VDVEKIFSCMDHPLLYNPVYNALISGDQHLGHRSGEVSYFEEEVSPFAGFAAGNEKGFSQLHELLPAGRKILYARPEKIEPSPGWQLQHQIGGLQFVYEGSDIKGDFERVMPLTNKDVDKMTALVRLTKPGPFGKRTIEFGHYHGIFEKDQLVAMTGQRLHVENYTELSAVCTHPDHLGKGYASVLLRHQLRIILQNGQQPFLHVRDDNERAIGVYERLGFVASRPMIFYFMKRE